MERIVILSLVARDADSATEITLQPGDLVERYRIRRDAHEASEEGVYFMDFESRGHRVRCPLVRFQARTAPSTHGLVEQHPARDTAAVAIEAVSEARAGTPRLQ